MDHVAIMKKSWGLLEKILTGEKTVESRWYRSRYSPWDKISSGDRLWFKNSGEPVTVKARVTRVVQFSGLTPKITKKIIARWGKADLGITDNLPVSLENYFKNKNYCLLVFFDQVKEIKPFQIDKTGFSAMAAWMSCEDIQKIRK